MLFIVAGGPIGYIPDLKIIQNDYPDAIWCGVDAGTKFLLDNGIVPMLAIGDFDSISEVEFENLKSKIETIHQLPVEKDQTDLEATLEYICTKTTDNITILGATGGRFDHALANLMIIQNYSKDREITILDRQNEMKILYPGEYGFRKNELKYISFIPISEEIVNVTLSGMRYPLSQSILLREKSLGISNEITQTKGYISFEKGICLVVRSKD